MNTTLLAGSALAAAMAFTTPLHAQLVRADVVVRGGPVVGRVVVDNERPDYYRRPAVVYAPPARVIVVERFRNHGEWRSWQRHGYRRATVYYVDGRYYDRGRPDAREVVVYERDGHFYRDCDDGVRYGHDHRGDDHYDRYRDRDRDHDRDRDRDYDRDHDRWER